MDQRLLQQQTQKLILSPQIRQYLKLLQMPIVELSQEVQTVLAENPLLEEAPAGPEEEALPSDMPVDPSEIRENTTQELKLGGNESAKAVDQLKELLEDHFPFRESASDAVEDLQKRKNYQETLITKPEGLSDYLLWQIRFADFSGKQKEIAHEIIGNIDDDGYLRATIEEMALALTVSPPDVAAVLAVIQNLEPPGIAARNLQEALVIQLEKQGPEAALALEIVKNHLPLLEKRNWAELAKMFKRDIEEIRKAAAIISRLQPRPGRAFDCDESLVVTPDATVDFSDDEDGKLKIEIHDEQIPELRINAYYRRLLRDKSMDEKTRAFLNEKMQAAVNFLKAIGQRKSTLRAITEEIVKAQPEFFERGFSHLKPLRLKDIASSLGIHESTVSRAIHGKYVSTPQGTIPYKSFFSTKLETSHGELESQKSIMEKIRSVIAKEDTLKPLSDEKIVKMLQAEGVQIARRTVAKYRELLRILPTHLRRKR